MKTSYEQLAQACGPMTWTEYCHSVYGRWLPVNWYSMQHEIAVTFDLANTPSSLQDSITFSADTPPNFSPVSSDVKQIIQATLTQWEQACGTNVKFILRESLAPDESGIRFATCQGLEAVYALCALKFHTLIPETITSALICLPPNNNDAYFHSVVTHEIGHALGLEHLHNIPTLQMKLSNITQGQGCSVMPYFSLIQSDINNCTTPTVCLDEPHAVNPGPWDALICQNLYGMNKLGISFFANLFKHVTVFAVTNGSIEILLKAFLQRVSINNPPIFNPLMTNILSKIPTLIIHNQYPSPMLPITNTLMAIDVSAEISGFNTNNHFQSTRLAITAVSLLLAFYQVFEHDDFMLVTTFAMLFLAANFGCCHIAEQVGSTLGDAANKTLAKLSFFSASTSQKTTTPPSFSPN